MSVVEDEIIAKFSELDKNSQINLLQTLQHQVKITEFDGEAWLKDIAEIRQHIDLERAGKPPMPSATDLINELREERDEQILRSIGFGDFSGDSDD